MSISFLRDISITATLQDCVDRSSNNEIVIVNSNTCFRYDITTGSQLGSNISTTNSSNRSVCLVTNASAAVWANTSNVDLIELNSGFKQNYSGVAAIPNGQTGQQSSGDTTNSIALAVEQAAVGKLSKFNGVTFAGSTVTVNSLVNLSANTTCITLKTAGRWLVGCDKGYLVEIDSSGNTYNIFQIPQQPNANYILNQAPVVCGISYDGNDFLAVTTTAGFVYVFAYTSKTLLYSFPFGAKDATTTNGTALCVASSGTTFLSYNMGQSTSNAVAEFDFTTAPASVRDVLFCDTADLIWACGVQNTRGWVLRKNNKITTFIVTSRNASQITSTIQNPPGTATSGRIIRIVDPNTGPPGAYVDCDTIIGAQSTSLPVVAGQSIIEVAIIGSGTDIQTNITRYSS